MNAEPLNLSSLANRMRIHDDCAHSTCARQSSRLLRRSQTSRRSAVEMRTLDKLTWHIMDAMADDWESIEQIQPYICDYCAPAPDERVFAILRELHTEGFIEIMEVGGDTNVVFPADPSRSWFSMTAAGRALWDQAGTQYRNEDERPN